LGAVEKWIEDGVKKLLDGGALAASEFQPAHALASLEQTGRTSMGAPAYAGVLYICPRPVVGARRVKTV
jgi:hypothetical protein